MQLVCPAGNLPALQAAGDNGADAVYAGFQDQTNTRAFPGLNFNDAELRHPARVPATGTAEVVAHFDQARCSPTVPSRLGFRNGYWHGEPGMRPARASGER